MRLAENKERKKIAINGHLCTIGTTLSGYIFATKAHINNPKKTC